MSNGPKYLFQNSTSLSILLLTSSVLVLSILIGFKDKLLVKHDFLSGVCKGCNVVIIDIDTLRNDAIDCVKRRTQTPNICGVVDKSAYFKDHISHSDFTPTSIVSTITSVYPQSHTFWSMFDDKIDEKIVTLPEVFRQNDYKTFFSDNTEPRSVSEQEAKPLNNQSNINAWFGKYEESLGFNSVFSRIKDLSNQGRPFFLYVYSWALHAPYITDSGIFFESDNTNIPPGIPRTNDEFENTLGDYLAENYKEVFKPELINKNPNIFQGNIIKNKSKLLALFHDYEGARESEGMLIDGWLPKYKTYFSFIDTDNPEHIQFLKSSYLEILKLIDKDIGKLIQLLDSAAYKNNTIIVIKSDHGEEFFEHGSFNHQNNLYQELIHSPLIIKVPGVKAKEINHLTQDIDVMPTILELVGVDIPAQAQGKSLIPLMINPGIPINDYQIAQKGSGDYVSTFRKGDWKLIMKDLRPIELYNLAKDLGETSNVIKDNSDRAAKLFSEYNRIIKSYPIYGGLDSAIPEWIDEEKRERLKKEGYF